MFETAQSMELANKEDFQDASALVDNMVNKVSIHASPGHSKMRKSRVVFVVVESILHQDVGLGRFNVTSVTLRVTLLDVR